MGIDDNILNNLSKKEGQDLYCFFSDEKNSFFYLLNISEKDDGYVAVEENLKILGWEGFYMLSYLSIIVFTGVPTIIVLFFWVFRQMKIYLNTLFQIVWV